MIDKEKKQLNMKMQWMKFGFAFLLYVLFIIWIMPQSVVGWILAFAAAALIFDVYITKKIHWQWWKDSERPVRFVMSWVDALVFALGAVYFINLFLFQNFVIPSSSLEKSLLTGDYLFVSKVSYGPRIPQTPLTMPLTQHTLPIVGTKSYIEWPHWDYRRMKGLGHVELNDIVVFNYPAGDTILTEQPYQTEYYNMVYGYGRSVYYQETPTPVDPATLAPQQQRDYFAHLYTLGRNYLSSNIHQFGNIDHRPTDRRENYVKRCVGMPGMTLQIKNDIVYLNGKPNKEPDNVQYTYFVKLRNVSVMDFMGEQYDQLRKDLGITMEDLGSLARLHGSDMETNSVLNPAVLQQFDGYMPLTSRALNGLKRQGLLAAVRRVTDRDLYSADVYPLDATYGWTRDNYGPVIIPKKGMTLPLTMRNIAVYERLIKVYENNDLVVKNNKIYINGKEAHSYKFKMDYYWMMGDNRHNSADSRYWGFVPEDHVVGKPIFIWWSSDPDRHGFSGIRWGRLFNLVDNIK